MKRLLFSIYLWLVVASLWAVPAHRQPFDVRQPDGSTLTVRLCGDEYFHYYLTMDNVPIVEDDEGSFYYAMLERNRIVPSSVLAHSEKDRNKRESKACRQLALAVNSYIDAALLQRNNQKEASLARPKRIDVSYRPTKLEGKKKGLVILVNFANLSMTEADANVRFADRFNKEGYHENSHIGSVHDYFYAQSYGALDLTFDVVGPVTLSKNYGYYGNNMDLGTDIRVREMVVEACKLVDSEVDFSDYDWDGDGEVEQVYFIYAGYGESYGAPSNTIWPHKSTLSSLALELDGVKIDTYACSCELSGRSGSYINGIGTACHEFSHCLGLPDLYDTSGGDGVGMGYWSVMCSGSYSGATGCGEAPCGYSAYERWFLGWMDLEELTDTCRVKNMPCIGDSAVAYVIYNDNNRDEYLLLENRQSIDWFSFVGTSNDCHGLLVTHVDYSEKAWTQNAVNVDEERQRLTFIPADKDLTCEKLEGTLFPGFYGVKELTDESHESAGGQWNTMNQQGTYRLNAPVTNIREKDGQISFYFKGGLFVKMPTLYEADEITESGFEVRWDFTSDADSYTVEIEEERPYQSWLDSIVNPHVHLIIDSIADNNYKVKDLKTAKYRFRIKANNDGASSKWTDYKHVDLVESTSVTFIVEDEDTEVVLYDLGGTRTHAVRPGSVAIKVGRSGKNIKILRNK